MGDYHLQTRMFSIDMGGCDIVLGVEWLCTMGPITMDFQDLYMSFVKDYLTYFIKWIKTNHFYIISSHHMEKLLKKDHSRIITQLHALQGCETLTIAPPSEMQQVLDTYISVFDLPIGLPPCQGEHDHTIPLISDIQPPNAFPYWYPFSKKNEIEKFIHEILAA